MSSRIRRILVGVEVAVSVALVLMTGLLTTSLVRLLNQDRGFAVDRILTATVDLPTKSYSDTGRRFSFYKQILARLAQLPGVEQAASINELPLSGDHWFDMIRLVGESRPFFQVPSEHLRWVSPGYFETIRPPLVAGRYLSASDEGKRYALVSEFTARTIWPGKSPIGNNGDDGGRDAQGGLEGRS
jgi:hypothetical protein